jgi:Skp family chaperone for outer membrane proteins
MKKVKIRKLKLMNYWLLGIGFFTLMFSSIAFPITLVRVGFIDLDSIISRYTVKYIETQISVRESYVNKLTDEYNRRYFSLTPDERRNLQTMIQDHKNVLETFIYNLNYFKANETVQDSLIKQIIQRDIMSAIQKTSELEGFHLILDKTGNFIYGSEDINLTEKVLFRLEDKLLDMRSGTYVPKVPLIYELEGY